MAQLKAGSTVGGVALLLVLKPSNLVEGAGTTNQFLGVNANNDLKFLSSFYPQLSGTTYGYVSGGVNPGPFAYVTPVLRFPFSAPPIGSTSVGALSQARNYISGHSSSTDGFAAGGTSPPTGNVTTTDKFPFAAPFVTATNAGPLGVGRYSNQGISSETHGYVTNMETFGGYLLKFPFSTPFVTDTTSVLTAQSKSGAMATHSNPSNGFTSGGRNAPGTTNVAVIDKFPFSAPSGSSATQIGELSANSIGIGTHSATHGFHATMSLSAIGLYQFPFSAPFTTSTDLGNLGVYLTSSTASSSTSDAYISGGEDLTPSYPTSIRRFPFYTPFASVTAVGALSQTRTNSGGHQF